MIARTLTMLVLLLIAPAPLLAQSQSSDAIKQDIADLNGRSETLRHSEGAPRIGPPKKPKLSKEAKAALTVPDDLVLAYQDFLGQKDTGLAKLLPRRDRKDGMMVAAERPTPFVPTRLGGASYSFSTRKHDDELGEELILDKDIYRYPSPPGSAFWVGAGGAGFGFIAKLGDVALEDVTAHCQEAKFLVDLVAPVDEPVAREYQKLTASGFTTNGVFYKTMLPAEENTTYLLRTIRYDRADVLVAFRTIRREADGSFVIQWKMLKKNPVPVLRKKPCYFGPCR